MKRLVLFVCTGNTCRSPMAEGIFRAMLPPALQEEVEVLSAGTYAATGMPPAAFSRQVALENGIDIDAVRSRGVTRDLVERADLMIVMEEAHRGELVALSPRAAPRILLLRDLLPAGDRRVGRDLPDPIGGALEAYREAFGEIRAALRHGLPAIEERLARRAGAEDT